MASGAGGEGRPVIDTTVPHSARVWNYWLPGYRDRAADVAITMLGIPPFNGDDD